MLFLKESKFLPSLETSELLKVIDGSYSEIQTQLHQNDSLFFFFQIEFFLIFHFNQGQFIRLSESWR